MSTNQFPPGWDEARVQRVIDHYENMSEDELPAEDEAEGQKINDVSHEFGAGRPPIARARDERLIGPLHGEGGEEREKMDLADIHFHDSVLRKVVELARSHDLLFEVDYPIDWENNVFEPRVIAFRDVLNYRVDEGPFVGAPTLLDAYDEGLKGRWRQVTLQTNAGTRSLLFRSVELLTVDDVKRDDA